jgi:CTP:molybdopterin cytidylyltransferase MocA
MSRGTPLTETGFKDSQDKFFAVILAAGESTRMGSPKALLSIGGKTALEHCTALFLDNGIQDIRVVAGACHFSEFKSRLPRLPVTWLQNDAYPEGMLSSVRSGINSAGKEYSAFFILPVDIPLVRQRTVASLVENWRSKERNISILHPVFNEKHGHPPLISSKHIPEILSWKGPHGLKGFLENRSSQSSEIPVIDEYVLRDMDTPDNYRDLIEKFSRNQIPSSEECESFLGSPSFFSPETASHCRTVSDLAVHLSRRLLAAGVTGLDIQRISAASLLHDIAKGKRGHAKAGALQLNRLGFCGISNIVSEHVDIRVTPGNTPTEAEIVYLSDKMVKGTTLVSLEDRFQPKFLKYENNPDAQIAIQRRLSDAKAIKRKIEHILGMSMDYLLNDHSWRCPI